MGIDTEKSVFIPVFLFFWVAECGLQRFCDVCANNHRKIVYLKNFN